MKLIFSSIFIVLFFHGFSQDIKLKPTYPIVKGYFAIVHPIITFDKDGNHTNFSKGYTVGFPMGINILKSDKIGLSIEIVPFVKTENGTDKVNNVLFHPGIIFRLKNGYSFVHRLAFETTGRYGITPVVTKIFHHADDYNLFVSMPVPVRFGNVKPVSVGIAILFGIGF